MIKLSFQSALYSRSHHSFKFQAFGKTNACSFAPLHSAPVHYAMTNQTFPLVKPALLDTSALLTLWLSQLFPLRFHLSCHEAFTGNFQWLRNWIFTSVTKVPPLGLYWWIEYVTGSGLQAAVHGIKYNWNSWMQKASFAICCCLL